jgi:hypothetical protein
MFFGVYWWICGVFGVGRKGYEKSLIFWEIRLRLLSLTLDGNRVVD